MQPLHCDLQPLSLVTTSLSSVSILRHPFVITSLSHNPSFPSFMWSIVMWCTVMWCKISQYYLSVTRKIASQLLLINVFWFFFKNHPGHSLGGVTVLHFVRDPAFLFTKLFSDHFSSLQNGRAMGHRPWALHGLQNGGACQLPWISWIHDHLTVSPKNDQTCAFMFLQKLF